MCSPGYRDFYQLRSDPDLEALTPSHTVLLRKSIPASLHLLPRLP